MAIKQKNLLMSSRLWYPVILLIIGGWLLLFNLGQTGLRDWDEGIYALISQEAAQHPSLTLTLNQTPWLEKPPLGLWLEAASIKLFGFSEWAIRLSSALCLLASLLLIYALGKNLFNSHVGFVATLLTLISPAFFYDHQVRSGDLEAVFLMTALLSWYFLIKASKRPQFFVWSGAAAGLCLMTRGSSALLVMIIGALYVWLSGAWRQFTANHYLGYVGVWLIIVLPWHLQQFIVHGRAFWDIYVTEQFLGRISAPLQNHSGSWHYYLDYFNQANLMMQMAVWTAALYFIAQSFIKRDKKILWLWLWPAFIFMVLSAMQTKLRWYAIIAIPALMLMLTVWLAALLKQKDDLKAMWWALIADALMIYWWLAQIDVFNIFKLTGRQKIIFLILSFIFSLLLWLVLVMKNKKLTFKFWPLAWLLSLIVGVNLLYARRAYRLVMTPQPAPAQVAAQALSEQAPAGANIAVYQTLAWYNGWLLPQAEYYLTRRGGYQLTVIAPENLAAAVNNDNFIFYLTNAAGLKDLDRAGAGRYGFDRLLNKPLTATERLILVKKVNNF